MLEGCRVVDLTDERGLLCGQILADLGADVIQVEPPAGSRARLLGPFADDAHTPETSLYWWAYARNKRSLVLDLERPEERASFLRLVRSADFLIESESPGRMDERGLGYRDLCAENPRLVYVSLSPFGQRGPKAGWAATDLVLSAASGLLAMTGDEERRPVRVGAPPQAYHFAALEGAVGALLAHRDRLRSGRGQQVDVSAQQALNAATQCDGLSTLVADTPTRRAGGGMYYGGVKLRLLYPASDGYVSIAFLFGSTFGPATRRLMDCVHEAGFCDVATRDKDWIAYARSLASGAEPQEEFERVKRCLEAFTRTRSKAQLLRLALDRKLLISPVCTIPEILESPQLEAREYFRSHETRGGRKVAGYPGPFARFAASPIRYRRPAPRLGEHSEEILAELEARHSEPLEPRPGAVPRRPLQGVRVLDFMWAVSGPTATRVLADFGATVVRIESPERVDPSRTLRPARKTGSENSALFHSLNAGKRMMTLDLKNEAGRKILEDLVRWADVVADAFAPGVMGRLGLAYADLCALNPRLVVMSTNLMGQTGPLNAFAGYGNMASAWCGFYEVTGWPDLPPVGPWGAYTDHVAARYNAIALLAALQHREATGEGQYVDLSQAEASLHLLAPALLDCAVNGRTTTRCGNRDAEMAPHDVYPVRGGDRWIAIAVESDAQWCALCEVLGEPERGRDPGNAGALLRRQRLSELDGWIASRTAERDGFELESVLQRVGVPASVVQHGGDLPRDAQLAARSHFVELAHPEGGTTAIEGARFLLSETPAQPDLSVPTLGRDNEYVLKEILGYDDERIARLTMAGALG